MKKQKICGVLGLGLAVASLVPGAIINDNANAEGPSSFLDIDATEQCLIDSYNADTGKSATDIEDIVKDAKSLKNFSCPNAGMRDFRGITMFSNLETVDISGNPNLKISEMDFSQNPKLKTINLTGSYNSGNADNRIIFFNFSNNPALESIIASSNINIVSVAYGEVNDGEEYQYKIDYSKLKFIDGIVINEEDEIYPAKHDEDNHAIYFKNNVPSSIIAKKGDTQYTLSTRGYNVQNLIYFEGADELESHGEILLAENCKKIETESGSSHYACINQAFSGDKLNTDEYIENTLKPIFNLEKFELSGIEIVPPTANLALETNTDTSKVGVYKASNDMYSNLNFKYHFSPNIDVPDTGRNTKEQSGAEALLKNITIVTASLASIAAATIFAIRSLGHKVKFTRK